MKKKLMSAILAGAMVLIMAIPAFAENDVTIGGTVDHSTDTYTLTIPSSKTDFDLTTADAQELGKVSVSVGTAGLTFNSDKKVVVTISSANKGKLKNIAEGETDTLSYNLSIAGNVVSTDWDTNKPVIHFSANEINDTASDKGKMLSIAMTDADAYKSVKSGSYQDVLTFSGELKSKTVSYTATESSNATCKTLTSDDFGTADAAALTLNGKAYTVYKSSAFINKTKAWTWNDAKGFVSALNNANYDGHTDWSLLPYATSSDDKTAIKDYFSEVPTNYLLSDSEYSDSFANIWSRNSDDWGVGRKDYSDSDNAFVVVYPQN